MKRLPAIMIIGAVSTVAAACGSDHNDMDMGSGTTAASAANATTASAPGDQASFNDADVAFAQGMIPHHQQAVEMAELALDPTREASAEVVDLATRIQAAQDPEIQLMTGWLDAWGQPMEMDMAEGDMGSMEGMMSEEDMAALAAASGTDFDRMWLEMMTAHHQGAVKMAETEQTAGMDPDAIALAGQIIAAQQAEIEEMRGLLEG
ncbi:MAG: DUF305 domain-containing protein [Ilumatobacteraceae bacterium]